MSPTRTPEPTELIYAPRPSWAPIVVAAGIALLAAGSWMGWVLWVIGGIVVLVGARSWWRAADDEVSRMRRVQSTDTAVVPAEPILRRR